MADNEFKSNVKAGGPVGMPQFGPTVANIAYQGSILGDIGAQMASAGSQELAKTLGYSYGQDPQGDLGIPITKFDKVMTDAYKAQSQATLSNRANEMLLQGQIDLAKQNKLTPEYIQSYKVNMARGLRDITQMAPTDVKQDLENRFTSHLMQTDANLQIKLAGQQKKEEAQNYSLYQTTSAQDAFNFAYDGQLDASEDLYNEIVKNNAQKREAGLLTPAEEYTSNQATKLAHFSGYYSKLATQAMNEGKLTTFMNDFVTNKPDMLNPSEFMTVLKNVTGYISGEQRQRENFQSLQVGQAKEDILTGQMTSEKLAGLKNELSEENYLKVETDFFRALSKGQKKQQLIEEGAAKIGDATFMASISSSDDINSIFDEKKRLLKQQYPKDHKGAELDDDNASILAVQQSAVPIPKFTKEIDRLANNGPQDITRAIQMYNTLNDSSSAPNVSGVSEDSKNIMSLFEHFSGSQDPVTAYKNAYDSVYKTDKARKEIINTNYNNWHRKHLSTQAQIDSFTNEITQMPWFNKPEILDKSNFQASLIRNFKDYVQNLDGNIELAKQRLKNEVNMTAGTSYVNGSQQYMPFAPELLLQKSDVAPFVRHDYAQQLSEQLKPYNEAFKAGNKGIDDYYEVVMPVSPREALESKNKIAMFENDPNRPRPQSLDEMFGVSGEINEHRKKISSFEANAPVKIIRHFRDGSKKEYTVSIEPNRYMAQTNNPMMRIKGAYNFVLRNEQGQYEHSFLPSIAMNTFYGYRMRPNLINSQYDIYHNTQTTSVDLVERIKQLQQGQDVKADLMQQQFRMRTPL